MRSSSSRRYTYNGGAYAPFRAAAYRWPHGHAYHRYDRGAHLPRLFWLAQYLIEDFIDYGLAPPPDGFEWVRYGPDLLLIDENTGEVQDAVYGAFEDSGDVQASDDQSDQGPPSDQSQDQSQDNQASDQSVGADPLDQAQAGLDALNRGDNDAAIRLFTEALKSRALAGSDRELAYVKRAEAYLAQGDRAKALADANRALGMNSTDGEASDVRDQAQSGGEAQSGGPGHAFLTNDTASDGLNQQITDHNQAIESENQAAQANYQAQQAQYEAEKQAQQAAYEQQLAAHQAQVEALDRQRAADLAAWQARVAACKGGDTSQCGSN